MNKYQISTRVAKNLGVSQKDVMDIINGVFTEIMLGCLNEGKVLVTGFGTFYLTKGSQGITIQLMPSDKLESELRLRMNLQ